MFEQLLKRTRRYVTTLSWVLMLLETVTAVIAGALVGASISEPKWWSWAIGIGIFYLFFLSLKFYSQTLFPAAVFGELEAQEKLKSRDSELARRNRIFNYLDTAIEKLNERTCTISQAPAGSICDESVEQGLNDLIEPLINLPHYILACDSDKFTVAARVGHAHSNPLNVDEWVEYFVTFRDDLGLSGEISGGNHEFDAFSDLNAMGFRFKLRNAMHAAYNHNEYSVSNISHDEKCFTIVSAPIPLVCEVPEAGGVICIITNCNFECPNDIPDVLRIYGRLIANWLAKYSDCINARNHAASNLPPDTEGGDEA